MSALSPRLWGVHLLALVLVGAAGALGWWQIESWQVRRAAEAVDLSGLVPLPLAEVMGPDDAFPGDRVGQPVVVEGTWLTDSTLYISGRERAGVTGYWAVTPLAVGGGDAGALPVVRGWTPTVAEAPAPPTGAAELVAFLQPGEGTGAVDDDPADEVLPQLRIADVIQYVDQDLYGGYGVVAQQVGPGDWPVGAAATNPGSTGLLDPDIAQLPAAGTFTALRNLLYGFEWWVFGGFAGFIWWRHVRDVTRPVEVDPPRGPEDLGGPDDPTDGPDVDPSEDPAGVAAREVASRT